MDPRFGRATWFGIYDTDKGTFDFIDNSVNVNAGHGAGIGAAQIIVKTGAVALVSGHFGPKALDVLKAAGIRLYEAEARDITSLVSDVEAGRLASASGHVAIGHE